LDLQLLMQLVPFTTEVVSSDPLMAMSNRYNIMRLSVTCGRSVVFSGYWVQIKLTATT